jgi:hypothetical protein
MEYCTSLYQRPTDQQKRNIKAKAESASTLSSLDPKKRITLNYLCHGHERPRMGLIYSPLGAGTHATRPIRRSPWGHDAAWADQLSRTEARGPPSSWPLRRSRQSSELARSSRSRTSVLQCFSPYGRWATGPHNLKAQDAESKNLFLRYQYICSLNDVIIGLYKVRLSSI